MKKSLLYCVLISASGILSQCLVGCNNDVGSGNNQLNVNDMRVNSKNSLRNGTDSIVGEWLAIVSGDSRGRHGSGNILVNNHTNSHLVRVGCVDGDPKGDFGTSISGPEDILPKSLIKFEKNTQVEYDSIAKKYNGYIPSSLEQQQNLITVNGDGKGHSFLSQGSTYKCYYKLTDNTNEPVFFAMKFTQDAYLVSSVLFQDLDKPYKDLNVLRSDNDIILQKARLGQTVSLTPATLTILSKVGKNKLRDIINTFVDGIMVKNDSYRDEFLRMMINSFNEFIKNNAYSTITRENLINYINLSWDAASSGIKNKYKIDNGKLEQSDMVALEDHLGKAYYNKDDISLTFSNGKLNLNASRYDPDKVFIFEKTKLQLPNISSGDRMVISNFFKEEIIDRPILKTPLDLLVSPDSWIQLSAKFDSDSYTAKFLKVIADELRNPDIIRTNSLMENIAVSTIVDMSAFVDGEGYASQAVLNAYKVAAQDAKYWLKVKCGIIGTEFLISTFILAAIIDYFTRPPGVGSYDTGILSMLIMSITDQEADSWNILNPLQKIKANSYVTNATLQSNSMLNKYTLTYSDNESGVDKQSAYTLELSYLDNPFIRAGVGDDIEKKNKWFGDVSKGQYNEGDGLITMSIEQTADIASDSIMHEIENEALKISGFSDNMASLVSAPQIIGKPVIVSLLPNANSKLSNSNLLSKSNIKLLETKVSGKYGDVNGYVLPENSKLSIDIKVDNNTGFRDLLYSNGLTARFISNNDDYLQLTKSIEGYNNLLFISPAVYSAYTCKSPYVYGSICSYEIALTKSNFKTSGKLYLSDVYGEQAVQPIFIGYNLILDQSNIISDGKSPIEFAALVSNIDGYDSLLLEGLPKGAKVISSCDSAMSYGDQCGYKLDFKGVRPGSYALTVSGKSMANDLGDSDVESITISISPPA